MTKQILSRILLAAALTMTIENTNLQAQNAADTKVEAADFQQNLRELLNASQKDKKGLMFYIKGQSIPGVVTKVLKDGSIEVRNQQYGRIVIRIESIDAVAMN